MKAADAPVSSRGERLALLVVDAHDFVVVEEVGDRGGAPDQLEAAGLEAGVVLLAGVADLGRRGLGAVLGQGCRVPHVIGAGRMRRHVSGIGREVADLAHHHP